MTWNEFVIALDYIRSRVRSERQLKEVADLREKDSIIKEIYNLLNGEMPNIKKPEPLPRSTTVRLVPPVVRMGGMVVYPREDTPVPRPPVLEETDEKGLGK